MSLVCFWAIFLFGAIGTSVDMTKINEQYWSKFTIFMCTSFRSKNGWPKKVQKFVGKIETFSWIMGKFIMKSLVWDEVTKPVYYIDQIYRKHVYIFFIEMWKEIFFCVKDILIRLRVNGTFLTKNSLLLLQKRWFASLIKKPFFPYSDNF